MAPEQRRKDPEEKVSEAPSTVGPRVGAWSKGGEFLGTADLSPASVGKLGDYDHCSVSRGNGECGIRFTIHAFDGGYRVLVERWEHGDARSVWLAPAEEEEESYIGLFSEEEVRERFPYLLAALEMPDGVEISEHQRRPESGRP